MIHVKKFMVEDAKFQGQENSSTALKLIETTVQIVNSTFLSNTKGLYSENLRYYLVVQSLLPTVQFISAKANLNIMEQTLVELYLQNRTASLT